MLFFFFMVQRNVTVVTVLCRPGAGATASPFRRLRHKFAYIIFTRKTGVVVDNDVFPLFPPPSHSIVGWKLFAVVLFFGFCFWRAIF